MAGPIVNKFGVWLESMNQRISHRFWVVCICTCARADVPSVLYLGNDWTDCAEIWYVVRGQLAKQLTQVSVDLRSFIAQKASYWFKTVSSPGIFPLYLYLSQNALLLQSEVGI